MAKPLPLDNKEYTRLLNIIMSHDTIDGIRKAYEDNIGDIAGSTLSEEINRLLEYNIIKHHNRFGKKEGKKGKRSRTSKYEFDPVGVIYYIRTYFRDGLWFKYSFLKKCLKRKNDPLIKSILDLTKEELTSIIKPKKIEQNMLTTNEIELQANEFIEKKKKSSKKFKKVFANLSKAEKNGYDQFIKACLKSKVNHARRIEKRKKNIEKVIDCLMNNEKEYYMLTKKLCSKKFTKFITVIFQQDLARNEARIKDNNGKILTINEIIEYMIKWMVNYDLAFRSHPDWKFKNTPIDFIDRKLLIDFREHYFSMGGEDVFSLYDTIQKFQTTSDKK